MSGRCDISVIIVNYNTRELIGRCLTSLIDKSRHLKAEIIVVDNGSEDGSAELIEEKFPQATLIRAGKNLGFAAANNLGFKKASGRYFVLLNSDAFLHEGALERAIAHMDKNPYAAVGGGRLIGTDGSWQPSARMLPSPLNDFLHLTGLAARFPDSPLFGRADRTFAPIDEPARVGWVPGAFSIIRPEALEKSGPFDERFFLYYEEIDLCHRLIREGWQIWYWPDVVVTHLGGETTKMTANETVSKAGSQLTLWRLRSGFLYYRKQYGYFMAYLVKLLEKWWHRLRALKNGRKSPLKAEESLTIASLVERAWKETEGGAVSPPRPW